MLHCQVEEDNKEDEHIGGVMKLKKRILADDDDDEDDTPLLEKPSLMRPRKKIRIDGHGKNKSRKTFDDEGNDMNDTPMWRADDLDGDTHRHMNALGKKLLGGFSFWWCVFWCGPVFVPVFSSKPVCTCFASFLCTANKLAQADELDKETNRERVKEMKRKRKNDARLEQEGNQDDDDGSAATGVMIGYPSSESDDDDDSNDSDSDSD